MSQFVVMLGGRSKRNPKRIEWSVEFCSPNKFAALDVLERYRDRYRLKVRLVVQYPCGQRRPVVLRGRE